LVGKSGSKNRIGGLIKNAGETTKKRSGGECESRRVGIMGEGERPRCVNRGGTEKRKQSAGGEGDGGRKEERVGKHSKQWANRKEKCWGEGKRIQEGGALRMGG